MDRSTSVEDHILDVIVRVIEIERDRMALDMRLDDLVSDSFLLVQLSIDLQDEFDVIFHAEDLNKVLTVGDVVELVRTRL